MPDALQIDSGFWDGDEFRLAQRIYYADTDAGGVVYHANYLVFAERARTEMLRSLGHWDGTDGYIFVVRHCTMDFQAPARRDDLIEVASRVMELGGASVAIEQRVRRDNRDLVTMLLRLVCIDGEFRPVRVPADLRAALEAKLGHSRVT